MVKPFLDHLEDLRWMLFKMLITLAVTMTGAFAFRRPLMQFLQQPLDAVLGPDGHSGVSLMITGVADSVTISFTLAFYAGVVIGFPVLLYFLAGFVLPALTPRERRYLWPAVGVSFGLFLVGVGACYRWILPLTLKFFFADGLSLGLRPNWTLSEYVSFVTNFTLAFGLSFELPVVVIVLVKFGLLTHAFLRRTRSYAVVLILVLAMLLAPPDLLTMLTMAAPMLLLYEATIWVAWLMERSERRRLAAEEAGAAGA